MEGEGYFACRASQGLTVQITMTDFDVIDRLKSLLGFGSVRVYPLPSGKTAYRWTGGVQPKVAGLMMMILPLMGERRAETIRSCLVEWKTRPTPNRDKLRCDNGHDLSGDNLRLVRDGIYTKRRCRQCGRDRQRRHRERHIEESHT